MLKKLLVAILSCLLIGLWGCGATEEGQLSQNQTVQPQQTIAQEKHNENFFESLFGCFHSWESATCVEASKCQKCGEVKGEPLGHDFVKASCLTPKTCRLCGCTEGDSLGHNYQSMVCTVCGTVDPRYKDVQQALVDSMRYIRYSELQLEILELSIERFEKFGGFDYLNDALEATTTGMAHLTSIIEICGEYPELRLLVDACGSFLGKDHSDAPVIEVGIYIGKDVIDAIKLTTATYYALCDEYNVEITAAE